MGRIPRLAGLGATLLSLCLVLACNKSEHPTNENKLRGTINVLVSLDGNEYFSQGKLEEQAALAQTIATDYSYLNPGVRVQIELAQENDLANRIRSRNQDGLSPDLILASSRTAHKLYQERLTNSVQASKEFTDSISPRLYQRFRIANGNLTGIPAFLVPQLACYNRSRVSEAPTSFNQLVAMSDGGIEVGMALDMVDLFWTVGAWAGKGGGGVAPSSQALTPSEQQALMVWLQSLLESSKHLRVNYYDNQEELIQGFLNGRLDWITCRSSNLNRLRKKIGNNLGVSPLPTGPAGPPTPITVAKAWVFGRYSNQQQQRISSDFAYFSTNTIMQRYIALTTEQMLPANRKVPLPTAGSQILAAMVVSNSQSQVNGALGSLVKNNERLKQVSRFITEMIYGQITPEQAHTRILAAIQ